jgi:hypothetical protein
VLTELIKVPDLLKILEKSDTSLKWKMIKEVFERRKNESRFVKEKGKIFPNLTRIIILEAIAAFVAYENTQINPTTKILAKTILTLNHYRRVGKGSMICFEQLTYIWLISYIETKRLIFNNLLWFSQRPLEIVKEEEWKDLSEEN